jgi:hypothetical protein
VQNTRSLAIGYELSQEMWTNFVERLRHDCKGEGVRRHYTADAIFVVQAKEYIYGLDKDYAHDRVIYRDGNCYENPDGFYQNGLDEDERKEFDIYVVEEMGESFLLLYREDQLACIRMYNKYNLSVVGRKLYWRYVNSHFTRDAADAFIARKSHDYPSGLRVYVDAQTYCWEYNTIKEAILNGKLVFKE